MLLSNGAVYYGKLSGYGSRYPTLTDIFYIVSKTDPNTKQVANVLVKRGKELHGPDRMYLNASQIIFVEPVGPDSKVSQLINEANHEDRECSAQAGLDGSSGRKIQPRALYSAPTES